MIPICSFFISIRISLDSSPVLEEIQLGDDLTVIGECHYLCSSSVLSPYLFLFINKASVKYIISDELVLKTILDKSVQ